MLLRAIRLLGCDPGLASFGVAHIYFGTRLQRGLPNIVRFAVHKTAKEDKRQGVKAADDMVMRAESLHAFLEEHLADHSDAVCAEAMSFPRSSSAAAKLATAWGLLIGGALSRKLPIVVASPQQVRDKVVGELRMGGKRIKTDKKDVADAVQRVAHVTGSGWDSLNEIAKSDHEHAWDAAAAALALIDSELVRSLRT